MAQPAAPVIPQTSPEPPARPARLFDRRSPPTLLTLVVISGIGPASMNIFLPSLPSMTAYFQTDYAVMQLSVTAYLAVMALLQLILGPLSDRFGRRPVLLASFAALCLSTIGCLYATSIEAFLAFRMIQASAAAGLVLSRAMVRDLHGVDKSASMIGYITMGMAVAPMLSPMLGGVLEQSFGWKANFIALLIFGVIALALSWSDVGETNSRRSSSLLEQARAYPELVRSRRFWGYAAAAAFASGAFFSFLGGAPYVAAEVFGLSPAELGVYFGMIAFGYMSGNFISGRFSERVGINRMILMGTLASSAVTGGALLLFLSGVSHPLALFGPIFLVGFGNGMTIPNATAGTLSVRPHLAGSAAGLGSTVMVGGGAVVATITGWLLAGGDSGTPLVAMMFGCSAASVVAMIYVRRVERRRGPLSGTPAAE